MPLKTTQEEQLALNMTPMIDVVFLLIIFFMVGSKFAGEERKIKLRVPAVGSVATLSAAPQSKVIHVMQDGQVLLDERVVGLEQLTAALQQARGRYPDLSVAVRGDAQGAFQHVASVLGACRAAGVSDMSISVRLARRP